MTGTVLDTGMVMSWTFDIKVPEHRNELDSEEDGVEVQSIPMDDRVCHRCIFRTEGVIVMCLGYCLDISKPSKLVMWDKAFDLCPERRKVESDSQPKTCRSIQGRTTGDWD